MHHGLHVDADHADEHVTGVSHDRQASEEGEGGEKGHDGVSDPLAPRENGEGKDVQGRRAKLEGEDVPLVAPVGDAVGHVHGENQLLVDLQGHEHHPSPEEDTPSGLVLGVAEPPHQKSRGQKGEYTSDDVEKTVGGRGLHVSLQP